MVNMDIINFITNKNKNNVQEIGRGGNGIVYKDNTLDKVVFKISENTNTCRNWDSEYGLYKQINKLNINYPLCKVIKMLDYYIRNNEYCILELERVINPINNNLNYTIQPQFGYNNLNYKDKNRGLFLGINELYEKKIFTPENIKIYCHDLGGIMAKLHYLVKNDCYDIEVFVGREDYKIILYIGDFDLSKMIINYDNETVKRIIWSLDAVPYFPTPSEQKILYDIFKNEYLNVAILNGYIDIAKYVLKQYEENN